MVDVAAAERMSLVELMGALTERGEPATEPAPSTEHLRNEPIYVSQLRNPMWKSSKAAAQRERVAAAEQAAAEMRAPVPLPAPRG